ncbi:MAG: hypothetical protein AAFY82_08790 [Pseudomonadota bacterium]
MSAQLTPLFTWFETTIASSPIWSAIGLIAAIGFGVYVCWALIKKLAAGITALRTMMARRKRQSSQGFGIAVAPIIGAKGAQQTKAIVAALDAHLDKFVFGSPFEIVRAPRMRAKGAKGLRAAAIKYLETSSTDLILWGLRPKSKPQASQVEILSCSGSLAPSEAMHLEGYFPLITPANEATTSQATAYLVARALQPGLSDGSAYKAEKLAPVADILLECLQDQDALPDRTRLTIETDYASMALHLGGEVHLQHVVTLRSARLSGESKLPPSHEIQARIDLGRALLGLSNVNFDPVRVREATDHLKIAIELLKADPILQVVQATGQAIQQGQAMLSNRKRFSVTGGSNI